METLLSYLENTFKALPETAEVVKIKAELASHMEEKYHELLGEGKSVNEAIGIVITDFGNIDELIAELDIIPKRESILSEKAVNPVEKPAKKLYTVTEKRAFDLIDTMSTNSRYIGLGVFLILLGTAALIFSLKYVNYIFTVNEDILKFLGLNILLICIAVAVGFFIYSGSKFAPYADLEDEVNIPEQLAQKLRLRQSEEQSGKNIKIIIGVMLCIIAPLLLISGAYIGGEKSVGIGLPLMLIVIGIAVYLFITAGSISQAVEMLFRTTSYESEKKKSEKVIGAVAVIWWPLTLLLFFGWSFTTNNWGNSWIIWPVAGIGFGAFSALTSIIMDE
ncbi:hypothetical protein AwErysi_04070 [Erysipelotrichaceae bacterium]|nr:hypothetical protein AwErysi_04070 [Erysipelotrichaceae bacterium]